MNVDKVYEKKFAKYVESIKKQIVDSFSNHNFEEMYQSYDISNSDIMAACTRYSSYLEARIKQAIANKDKSYLKSLTEGTTLRMVSAYIRISFDDNLVLTQRLLGEQLRVDRNGRVIFPSNLSERFETAGYLEDKKIFGPILDDLVNEGIQSKDVDHIILTINDNNKFTREEFKMALPYVVNKIVKQMKKQVEYEVKACEEGLYSQDAPLKLENLLVSLNDILGTHTNGISNGERDEELIVHFKNCSAAPILKEFCDNYFTLFNDGVLENYSIFKTTAYIDTAGHYADLFYGLDMLTVEDHDRGTEFKKVAYRMKNDDRRGGEPNPSIKTILLQKKK